jgi:restriction endonuclease S subunit
MVKGTMVLICEDGGIKIIMTPKEIQERNKEIVQAFIKTLIILKELEI